MEQKQECQKKGVEENEKQQKNGDATAEHCCMCDTAIS